MMEVEVLEIREAIEAADNALVYISEYLKFADIFMDGFVFDIMVQSKINNSKNQCEEAIRHIENIKRDLQNKL